VVTFEKIGVQEKTMDGQETKAPQAFGKIYEKPNPTKGLSRLSGSPSWAHRLSL